MPLGFFDVFPLSEIKKDMKQTQSDFPTCRILDEFIDCEEDCDRCIIMETAEKVRGEVDELFSQLKLNK